MSSSRSTRGFTLVELVTLLALLAFAATLLAPAMAYTKSNGVALRCLNNLRQLGTAWRMYADDNSGRLVWNRGGSNAGKGQNQDWVGGTWLDFTSLSDNTNTGPLIDHAKYPAGAWLGPYLKSAAAFKCPADRSTVTIAGQIWPRVRSVSMNNWIGEASQSWATPSQFQLYRKIDAIGKPTPAALWIILDEREESINDGAFFTNPDTAWSLIDYPAAYHDQGAGFAFADGHSQIHRWLDRRTAPILIPGQAPPFNTIFPGDVDITWLQQHATSRP
jgi:prepilin-type processing-associated H-X9-DG protein